MSLKEIKSLAEQARYHDALTECTKLFQDPQANKADVLRTRAYVFALSGDYERAIRDRETIFSMGEGTIRDYYLAADHALSSRDFAQTCAWLNEVLRLGEDQNEAWFKSAAHFLLAYAQMALGQYEEAIANLDRAVVVESSVAMLTPELGMCNQDRLRQEILKRQSNARKADS